MPVDVSDELVDAFETGNAGAVAAGRFLSQIIDAAELTELRARRTDAHAIVPGRADLVDSAAIAIRTEA